MEFTGDWNDEHHAGDWNDSRPQRPLNFSPPFDLGDDMEWNQALLQHGDHGYAPRPLRGATQQEGAAAGQLRGPLQRPPVPSSPLITEGLANASWDGQESRLSRMSEQMDDLYRKHARLSEGVQALLQGRQKLEKRIM